MIDAGYVLFVLFFLVGLVLGSFSSAVAYRMQTKESWIRTQGRWARSVCPHCRQELKFWNLVPILSWLFQRGRCAYCSAKISVFYPVIELVSGVLAVLLFYHLGLGWLLLCSLIILPFILAFCSGVIREKL